MEVVGKVIAGVFVVILIFLFPLQYIAESYGRTVSDAASSYTEEFTETARQQGSITLEKYEELVDKLNDTGDTYDISIEVSHPIRGKVIASAGEVIPEVTASNTSYKESTGKEVENIHSFDKKESSGLIQSFATHTHTDDCYNGTLHICNGTNCAYGSNTIVVAAASDGLYYSYDGITWVCAYYTGGAGVQGVTYGNGRFVAIAGGLTYTSTDGINWIRTASLNLYFYQVVYGNGVFVANVNNSWRYGDYYGSGQTLAYSTDGLNWTPLSPGTSGMPYDCVGYSNGSFHAEGGYTPYSINAYSPSFGTLVLSSENYTGTTTNSKRYMTSVNGTIISASADPYYGIANLYFSTMYQGNYFSNGVLGYLPAPNIAASYGNGVYLVGSSSTLYRSATGYGNSWTSVSVGAIGYFYHLIYFGDRFLAFTNGPSKVYQSLDKGSSWTGIGSNITAHFNQMACNAEGGSGVIDRGPCQKAGKYYNIYGNEVQPICSQVVTSIAATSPTQSIIQGGSIVTTATANYLDGHTGTVNCSVSGFNTNLSGTQTVTLTYSGLVGNARTSGVRMCTLSVSIQPNSKPCTAGLGHPNYAGTLSACPVCRAIAGISANNQTFYYDGSHHELTIGNTAGATVNAAYDHTDPNEGSRWQTWEWNTGPMLPGTYPVDIYVVVNDINNTSQLYFAMERYITIQPNLSSITVSPTSATLERYSIPTFTVMAQYQDGSSQTITSYTMTGLNTNIIGTQLVTFSLTANGVTKTATAQITVTALHITCPTCGTVYSLDANDTDNGCPNCKNLIISISAIPDYVKAMVGESLPVTVEAVYADGKRSDVTGWTSDFNSTVIGINEVNLHYAGFSTRITVEVTAGEKVCPICGRTYPLREDGSDPGCPDCKSTVVSIEASPENVTIEKHADLPITVKATFKDGHTEMVTGWSSSFMADTEGVYMATISYDTVTDQVTVTVLADDRITCPYCGLEYLFEESPEGCPVCYYSITGIEAELRSGGTQVILHSELNLQITAIYKDTHRQLFYTGYTVDDYDSGTLGTQNVTVSYGGFSTQLMIEVVKYLTGVTCPNGHIYYLNEDGSDPGCPYCLLAESSEEAIFYFDTTFTDAIIETLYLEGIYYLNEGDYITVNVSTRGYSITRKIETMFKKSNDAIPKKRYTFGGEVR